MGWQITDVCPRCAGRRHDLDGETCLRCFGAGSIFTGPPEGEVTPELGA